MKEMRFPKETFYTREDIERLKPSLLEQIGDSGLWVQEYGDYGFGRYGKNRDKMIMFQEPMSMREAPYPRYKGFLPETITGEDGLVYTVPFKNTEIKTFKTECSLGATMKTNFACLFENCAHLKKIALDIDVAGKINENWIFDDFMYSAKLKNGCFDNLCKGCKNLEQLTINIPGINMDTSSFKDMVANCPNLEHCVIVDAPTYLRLVVMRYTLDNTNRKKKINQITGGKLTKGYIPSAKIPNKHEFVK